MTIREIESRSGMTRANIRFYESEGLLTPERGENGYRNYSEENLQTLLRIRLLRSLRVPLEEIRRIQQGDSSLASAMNRHIATLENEKKDIDRSCTVCREIAQKRIEYSELDAPSYLNALHAPDSPAAKEDVLPPLFIPWRRFFARMFDLSLYSALWEIFLMLVCNVNTTQRTAAGTLLDTLVVLATMLILEPVMLRFFGATPGKWLLGLRVVDRDERKLSLQEAQSRTWNMTGRGLGLMLPIYQLVRMWKSFQTYADGEPLAWECDSVIILRDKKRRRYAACIAGYMTIIAATVLAAGAAQSPHYGSGVTAAAFSANFNRLAAYYQIDFDATLDENGCWVDEQPMPGTYVIHIDGEYDKPDFTFTEENGVIIGVAFDFETTDPTVWPPSFQNQMAMAALSFAGAYEGFEWYSGARNELLNVISDNEFRSFRYEDNGITIVCETEHSGYTNVGFLLPMGETDVYYSLSFSITKTE